MEVIPMPTLTAPPAAHDHDDPAHHRDLTARCCCCNAVWLRRADDVLHTMFHKAGCPFIAD
jgi:hypothetical protein